MFAPVISNLDREVPLSVTAMSGDFAFQVTAFDNDSRVCILFFVYTSIRMKYVLGFTSTCISVLPSLTNKVHNKERNE